MPPVRAFHLPGTEDDRPDAGADREHGELQAEEPLRAGGLHRGRHGHVECGEAHVEHHEHDQQWQNAPIRQYIARLGGIGPVQTTQPETVVFGGGRRCGMVSGRLECGSRLTGDGVRLRVRYFGGDDVNRLQHGRDGVLQREEHRSPDAAGQRGHEQLRHRVHRGGEERRQNRTEDEYDLIDSRFQRIRGVEQRLVLRTAQRIRPAGAHEGAERELGQPHAYGQREQHRDGHSGERRQCERKHRHYLHAKRHRSDTPLPEPVEQARVERRDRGDGEDVHGAHRPGDRPVVVHVVEREHDAQRHHRDRQSGHRSGDAERLGAGNAEQLRVRRLRCDGSALLLSPAHRVFSGVPA